MHTCRVFIHYEQVANRKRTRVFSALHGPRRHRDSPSLNEIMSGINVFWAVLEQHKRFGEVCLRRKSRDDKPFGDALGVADRLKPLIVLAHSSQQLPNPKGTVHGGLFKFFRSSKAERKQSKHPRQFLAKQGQSPNAPQANLRSPEQTPDRGRSHTSRHVQAPSGQSSSTTRRSTRQDRSGSERNPSAGSSVSNVPRRGRTHSASILKRLLSKRRGYRKV